MGSTERLCLRWNDFESNIKHGFSELREEEEFFDVTLACGSKQIKAHKVILSACSPFFRSIIKSVPHQHPLLYLRGIKFNHLESLLCFMYNGEVNVTQEELNNFLAVAEELKIKGLTQNPSSSSSPSPSPHSHSHSHSHSHPPSLNECAPGSGGGGGGGGPPSKRPRIVNKVASSPGSNAVGQTPSSANTSSGGGNGNGGSRPRVSAPSQRPPSIAGPQAPSTVIVDDDDIEDITHVKAEPKESTGNTMVVTPDVSLGPDDLGDDAYAHDDENYEEYAQYGSEPGEMSYTEGGSMLDPGLAAVPGPSGAPTAADGNKGLLEELEREIDTYVMDDTPGISSCRKCGYSTTVRSRLRRHIEARHVTTRGFICDFCGFVSKTRHSLREHIRHRHSKSKCLN